MANPPESHRHHYVPEGLLSSWERKNSSNQNLVLAYQWDTFQRKVVIVSRSTKSFCWEKDLNSLIRHPMGRDALETQFFGPIDDKGLAAKQVLIDGGLNALTNQQRQDFCIFLMSLRARRPEVIAKLRTDGAAILIDGLDTDTQISQVLNEQGISDKASVHYEKITQTSIQDRAQLNVQKLILNEAVGKILINANWGVYSLRGNSSFMLSDEPLVTLGKYDSPQAMWLLPLGPKHLFYAANFIKDAKNISTSRSDILAKKMNIDSISQADKFVFSISDNCHNLVEECWRKTGHIT